MISLEGNTLVKSMEHRASAIWFLFQSEHPKLVGQEVGKIYGLFCGDSELRQKSGVFRQFVEDMWESCDDPREYFLRLAIEIVNRVNPYGLNVRELFDEGYSRFEALASLRTLLCKGLDGVTAEKMHKALCDADSMHGVMLKVELMGDIHI
jgi:hypothetical protein